MYNIDKVKNIDWSMIEIEVLGGDVAEELIYAINKSMRHILSVFWKAKAFEKEVKEQYLTLKGSYDKVIRPSIYAAKVMALSLKFKIYDEKACGWAEFDVRDKCIKLIRSCVYHHISNDKNGWGGEDYTIGHVYELANTAWISWDKLNVRDRQLVVSMIEYEAKRLNGVSPKYDFNNAGMLLDSSESSVFYNTNVANLLRLAYSMLADHEKSKNWIIKTQRFYKSIFKKKGDEGDDGHNVKSDGYIISYSVRSPYAISQIATGSKVIALSWMLGEDVPEGALANFEMIYKAFYNSDSNEIGDGERIFVSFDKKNRPISDIKTPNGAHGGRPSLGAVYSMDMMAYSLGFDLSVNPTGREWAKIRMRDIIKNQKSGKSKYSMSAPQINRSMRGECLCSNLIDTYIALFIHIATKKVKEVQNVDKFRQDKSRKRKIEQVQES